MIWQFTQTTPDPDIAIDTLTDPELNELNYLLNWAHAVYTARVSYYNKRWAYAQQHHTATPWLDHAIISANDIHPNLHHWEEPQFLPDIDLAAWVT